MFKSVFYAEKGCLTHSLFLDNKKKIHFLLYFILLKIVSVFFYVYILKNVFNDNATKKLILQ